MGWWARPVQVLATRHNGHIVTHSSVLTSFPARSPFHQGIYIVAISTALLGSFDELGDLGSGAFIIERDTGQLIAASTETVSNYYDSTSLTRLVTTASPLDNIRFASNAIKKANGGTWPDSLQSVAWVNDTDATTYPSLNVGDAFYVSTELKQEDGIVWDIVIVQKVNCPVGYYVDSANLICAEW